MSVLVRLDETARAEALLPAFRTAVRDIDARLPVQEFTTVNDLYSGTIERRSFAMFLITLFGGVALFLSVIGLYGLVSYDVAQQRREIGVRIAFGASQQRIVARILGRGVRLVAVGLALGLAGAAALTRFLGSLLFGISPLDGMTFLVTAAVVAFVAVIATFVPALRAAGTSPLVAMRSST
jgi:putative ABC transport system permease protein